MIQPIDSHHRNDDDGNPAGGYTLSTGISIAWQNGPLGRGPDRREPNGAFVETVIAVALDRINYYQDSQFHCLENALAAGYLAMALSVLEERTLAREDREVEGTHGV